MLDVRAPALLFGRAAGVLLVRAPVVLHMRAAGVLDPKALVVLTRRAARVLAVRALAVLSGEGCRSAPCDAVSRGSQVPKARRPMEPEMWGKGDNLSNQIITNTEPQNPWEL